MTRAYMIEGRSVALEHAMLCANDHIFDLTLSTWCPKCASQHIVPVAKFLGVIAPKGFELESLNLSQRQMVIE